MGKEYGKGAFGEVRSAYHHLENSGSENCSAVAAKVVKLTNRDTQSKIIREFQLQHQLHHKNIIEVYATGQAIGPLGWKWEEQIIFMEAVSGGDLLDRLNAGLVGHDRALSYMRQMSDALRYMHRLDMVHMDLKLENVLISLADDIKLADFGFATKGREENEKSTSSRGSPAYAAPELFKSGSFNAFQADVFSLGATFFSLTTYRLLRDDRHYSYRTNLERLHCSLQPMDSMPRLICDMLHEDPKGRPTMEEVCKRIQTIDPASSLLQELHETSSEPSFVKQAQLPRQQAVSNLHLYTARMAVAF